MKPSSLWLLATFTAGCVPQESLSRLELTGLCEAPDINVVSLDLNSDGLLDFVSSDTAQLCLSLQQPDGSFVGLAPSPLVGGGLGTLLVGDIESDGDLDLFGHDLNGDITLLKNQGDTTFLASTILSPPNLERFALDGSADLDGDSDLDLFGAEGAVIQGNNEVLNSRLFVMIQQADGTFAPQEVNLASSVLKVTPADIDQDNDQDLLVFTGDFTLLVLKNQGDATFVQAESSPLFETDIFFFSAGATFADLDADGDLDLILPDTDVFYQLVIFINDGQGNFTEATRQKVRKSAIFSDVSVKDLDSDGLPEILLGENDTSDFAEDNFFTNIEVRVLRNLGGLQWDDEVHFNAPEDSVNDFRVRLFVEDLNGDAVSDLLTITESLTAGLELGLR